MGKLTILVPLREDAGAEAAALLRGGPPVDLALEPLDRYQAFLSEREAILVLEGPGIGEPGRFHWHDLATWKHAARWRRCAEGPPRLAEIVDSWAAPPEVKGAFFGPLPGPGDSEGGDIV